MFKNKTVAVTGASGGIGRAIGEMFAQNGAKVALSDLSAPTDAAAALGANAYVCDVSSEDSVSAFIDQAEADLGPIDIYVSNAGIGAGNMPAALAVGYSVTALGALFMAGWFMVDKDMNSKMGLGTAVGAAIAFLVPLALCLPAT